MPERWLGNFKPHPFSFIPFSGGGRNCVGERFARIEANLILVNLIKKFKIELAPSIKEAKLEYRSSLTVKSKPKVRICVESRNS
jgi:cytochrome P450 family 4 subfamily V